MNVRKTILFLVAFLPVLIPLTSFVIWKLKSPLNINILIFDMTVPYKKRTEHEALSWILIHDKFSRDGKIHDPNNDYRGFFPLDRFKYETKDFSDFRSGEILQIADSLDALFYTDTYGIYSNEWLKDTLINERSAKIYGGLTEKDLLLIRKMQEDKKLVMAEFNFLAHPTEESVRALAERVMDIRWTGWVGRFYDPLDTTKNADIPDWAKRLYQKQYGKPWSFKYPGIMLVHESSRIVVLENDSTLNDPVPWIYTSKYGQTKYGLPREIHYPYWFDINVAGISNTVVSSYKLYVNEKGRKILEEFGIPDVFPCVMENRRKNSYYFCGDFSDIPFEVESAYFTGVEYIKIYSPTRYDFNDRAPFFWNYYRPLLQTILKNYEFSLSHKRRMQALSGQNEVQ